MALRLQPGLELKLPEVMAEGAVVGIPPIKVGASIGRGRHRVGLGLGAGLSIPFALGLAYLVILGLRFPLLVSWLNENLDVGAAYVLATAVSHGHTGGVVVTGTQGAWAALWWARATVALPDHRLLWELSPLLMWSATAAVIGVTVGRLAGRGAGLLSGVLILSASPGMLWIVAAPWMHNTTFLGVALLGADLVWLSSGPRCRLARGCAAVTLSVVIGVFTASDHLLEAVGLVPFLLAPALLALRTRERGALVDAIAVALGVAVVAALTNAGMEAAGYRVGAPPAGLDLGLAGTRLVWLIEGIGRLGGAITDGGIAPARLPLTIAALVADLAALLATARLAGDGLMRPATRADRSWTMHVTFWASVIVCASLAYVLTGVAAEPADRYIAVVVPAVAAIVPLALRSARAPLVIAGASVFILSSLGGIIRGDDVVVANPRVGVGQADRLVALVREHHLGIGFAGYEDFGPLSWNSRLRLHLRPLEETADHRLTPASAADVAAWYRPRPQTHSYLVLSADDNSLPHRVPSQLPAPTHTYHVGALTVAAWPFDIAVDVERRWFQPSG